MIQQHFASFLMDISSVDSTPYIFMMFLGLFSAPIFFILVGISIILSVEKRKKIGEDNARIEAHILKRGILLSIIGFLFLTIWETDVLHYIGIYILIIYLTLGLSIRARLVLGVAITATSPLMAFLPYFNGTKVFSIWELKNSFDISEFVRGMFGSNFEPAFPCFSLTIFGSIVGSLMSQSLNGERTKTFQLNLFKLGSILVLFGSIRFLFDLSFDMYPALYVMLTMGAALLLLSGLIWLYEIKGCDTRALSPLVVYGRLSLSIYIGHIILWFGILDTLGLLLSFSLGQVLALLFSCYFSTWILGMLWLKIKETGPLELVLLRLSRS